MPGRTAAALLALLVCVARLAAEEEPPPFEIRLDYVKQEASLSSEESGEAWVLLGPVELARPGLFSLRAVQAIVWIDPLASKHLFTLLEGGGADRRSVPAWAVRAIYAEGAATPAVFQAEGRVYRCSSFFYDFLAHRGLLLDAEIRLRLPGVQEEREPVVLRAQRMRATGPGQLRAEEVSIFSTSYVEPEIALQVKRLQLTNPSVKAALERLDRVTARRGDLGGPTAQEFEDAVGALEKAASDRAGARLTLHGLSARAFGVPLFGWPKLSTDLSDSPMRYEVEVGSRGQLNTGVRLGVGMQLSPLDQDFRFLFGAGYYDRRGPLVDLEWELNRLGGRVKGRSFTVLLRDHGTDFGIEPPTRNRFWTQHRVRFEIDPEWRLDGEFSDLSDSLWLRVYDEREFKEGKAQETLLTLRRRDEIGYVTVTGKVRTIGFQDEVEERPRVAAILPVLDLVTVGATVLQLAGMVEAASLRHRRGDGFPLPDFDTLRVDADPTLLASFSAGPVRIVPSLVFRYTGYEESLAGAQLHRFAGTASIRADTQLSRWRGDRLHIVNVSLEFEDLYALSAQADELFPLDATDRLARYEMLGARVRNRLLRRTAEGLRTYVSLELFAAWFPGGERPLGARGDGLFEIDLEWLPTSDLEVRARSSLELERGSLETASLEAVWNARRDLSLGAGIRHLEGDSDILTGSAELEVETRWRLLVFSQFELRGQDWLDTGFLIQRLGQTLAVGVRIAFDPGDGDFSMSLQVDLLARFRDRKPLDAARRAFRWNER
ncbi:MAG: hypothetical protein ACT4PV_00660 [Planctomycetaceae bacterium]